MLMNSFFTAFFIEARYMRKPKTIPCSSSVSKKVYSYELGVQGVECDLCQEAVYAILKKAGAQTITSLQKSKAGSTRICFTSSHCNISLLLSFLRKEGFVFEFLNGEFEGKVTKNLSNSKILCLENYDMQVYVKETSPVVIELHQQGIFKGILYHETNTQKLWFNLG